MTSWRVCLLSVKMYNARGFSLGRERRRDRRGGTEEKGRKRKGEGGREGGREGGKRNKEEWDKYMYLYCGILQSKSP